MEGEIKAQVVEETIENLKRIEVGGENAVHYWEAWDEWPNAKAISFK